MITKQLSKQEMNTVLLNLYRREKNCELIQGNVFYNLTLIKDNYAKLSERLYNNYITIEKYKDRITALRHLIYGKIYDLYDEAMAAINNYNTAVAQRDYLVERKATLDTLIHQQEQRRDSELNTYNTYVNTYIPNKQTEIANKQAAVTAKQQQLDTTQAELDTLNSFLNTWDSFTFRVNGYLNSLHSLDYDRTGTDYEQAYYTSASGLRLDLELDMPTSIADYFDIHEIWPVYNMTRDMWVSGTLKYLKYYTSILGGRYSYGVEVHYNGTNYVFVSKMTASNTTANSAILGEYMSVYNNMKITLNNNRPSNEGLIALRDQYAAELATLQSELATLQSELATLESERDYHWNEYQDALNQIDSLTQEKAFINKRIDNANEHVNETEEIARQKSTRYNDAVAELPPEKQEEYTPLPAPWGDYVTPEDDDD